MEAKALNSMPHATDLFRIDNLFAWCVVPFDSMRRTSRQRAEMLSRLGFRLFAFDWRPEEIDRFDEEVEALASKNIELLAWWGGRRFEAPARAMFDAIERHSLQPQIWITGSGKPCHSASEQKLRVEEELTRIRPFFEHARRLNLCVALYNHGAWFGEPDNQLELIERLEGEGFDKIGIVYNLHHGHAHLPRFPKILQLIQDRLVAINLNGMVSDGDKRGMKIIPIGSGTDDFHLLRLILQSGWRGPVGILHHVDDDAEAQLRRNLDGLAEQVVLLEREPGRNESARITI